MAPENEIATVEVHPENMNAQHQPTSEKRPSVSAEKSAPDAPFPVDTTAGRRNPVGTRLGSLLRSFEQQLVEYNLEARGIERVAPEERMKRLSWLSYLQAFLLWVSINLAANNITLGMLGPAVYGLSFLDSALCAVFGAFAGALVASWMATWGPISGIRTMVCIFILVVFDEANGIRLLVDTRWVGGLAKSLSCLI